MTTAIVSRPNPDPILRAAGLEMNLRSREVRHRGVLVPLTPTEFRVLHALLARRGQICPTAFLEQILGRPGGAGTGKVQFYVSRLRGKLGDRHRVLIRNAHGLGYRIAGPGQLVG